MKVFIVPVELTVSADTVDEAMTMTSDAFADLLEHADEHARQESPHIASAFFSRGLIQEITDHELPAEDV